MNKINLLIPSLLLALSLFIFQAHAQTDAKSVAKVLILKGTAIEVKADGKTVTLAKDMWIDEGSSVKTEAKSFAKLIFVDKSQMNLGPSTEMVISKFPKNEAGIIGLMKGQLRSKVTKNYMDEADKDKSKLFIKTKSAAMGVRGTDFNVGFDPSTNATALDVISGEVAMVKSVGDLVDSRSLDQALNSPEAAKVGAGFSSSVAEGGGKPEVVKMPAEKMDSMKKSDVPVESKEEVKKDEAKKEEGKKEEGKKEEAKKEEGPKKEESTKKEDGAKKEETANKSPDGAKKEDAPKKEETAKVENKPESKPENKEEKKETATAPNNAANATTAKTPAGAPNAAPAPGTPAAATTAATAAGANSAVKSPVGTTAAAAGAPNAAPGAPGAPTTVTNAPTVNAPAMNAPTTAAPAPSAAAEFRNPLQLPGMSQSALANDAKVASAFTGSLGSSAGQAVVQQGNQSLVSQGAMTASGQILPSALPGAANSGAIAAGGDAGRGPASVGGAPAGGPAGAPAGQAGTGAPAAAGATAAGGANMAAGAPGGAAMAGNMPAMPVMPPIQMDLNSFANETMRQNIVNTQKAATDAVNNTLIFSTINNASSNTNVNFNISAQ